MSKHEQTDAKPVLSVHSKVSVEAAHNISRSIVSSTDEQGSQTNAMAFQHHKFPVNVSPMLGFWNRPYLACTLINIMPKEL